MNKEYFLVGFRTTIGKRGYKLIDKTTAISKKKAEVEFKQRNKINKLLEKYDLIVCEAVQYWS